jgi:PAS domain S-box-containing protein
MKRTILIALIAGVLLFLILLVSGSVVERRRKDMIKGATVEAELKTAHTAYLISEFIRERLNALDIISAWMNPNWSLLPKVYRRDIRENIRLVLRRYPGFDSIHFMNRQGIVVWGFPEGKSLKGVNFSRDVSNAEQYEKLFKITRLRKSAVVASFDVTQFDPAAGKLVKTEVLLIAAPIFRSETYLGALFAILRPKAIGAHFFPLRPLSSMKGTYWALVDAGGEVLYSNNHFPASLMKGLSSLIKPPNINGVKEEIRSQTRIIGSGENGGRHRVLVSYFPLKINPGSTWYVMRIQSLAQIEADIHRWLLQTRAIAFAAIVIMVFTAIFLMFSFRLSEKKLDSLNRKYRDLLDNLHVGAFSFAASGQIDYVNKRACELLGYRPEEILGKDRLFFAWDKERGEIEKLARQRIEGIRKAETYRTHMVHRSGRIIDVEVYASPVTDESGKVQSVRVMFTDVTRQVEMEREIESYTRRLEEKVQRRTQALRESESLYRSIFETSLAIIYIHQDDKFKLMNKTGMEFFGFKNRDEMLHANVWETIPEVERQRRRDNAIRRMRGDSVPSRYESLVINKDGEIRIVECNFQRILYWDETAILAILFDVTERKRLEAEIMHSEKLKSMGQLATGVAHDFNNILAAILGRIQLLEREPENSELVLSCARLTKKAVSQGISAVKRIQEYTRMRQDRLAPELLLLHKIIDDAIEITRFAWKDQAQKRGITINIELDFQDENFSLSSELREAFMNVIMNAVDAMPEGGTLRIHTESIAFKDGLKGVRIIFEDTGVGMSLEVMEHALKPFYTTKGSNGSGLGLSIVAGLVERLGGRVELESTEGVGTTVSIELPWRSGTEGEIMIRRVVSDKLLPERRSGSLLVVDDEPALPEIIREYLFPQGYDVLVATTGEEALDHFQKNPDRFALIFTDLGMPGINGWELARRVREISEDIPIILMTGWGLEISEKDVQDLKITELVSKPVTLDVIEDIVSRYIDLS